MSAYTKSEIQSMTIDQILFTYDYPGLEFALRETRYCKDCLVFRSTNAMVVRMLAIRVNHVLTKVVPNFKEYNTNPGQQADGMWFTVVPLKTKVKSDLPATTVDRIVTSLVTQLGVTCQVETSDGVEPSDIWDRAVTTVVAEVVEEIPDTAIAIQLPAQLPGKQATVAQLKKHLGVKSGNKAELLAQL